MSNEQHPPQQPQSGWPTPQQPQPPYPPRQPGWATQQQPAWVAPPPPQPPRKRKVGKILGIGCGGIFGLFVLLAALGAALGGGTKSSNASDSKPAHTASSSATPTTKATATPAADGVTARCKAEHWPQAMPKLAGKTFNPLDDALQCFDHLKAYAPDGHDVMNDTGANAQPWTIVSSQPAAGAQVNLSTPIVLKLREPGAATTKPAPTHVAAPRPATHAPAPVTTHHTTAPPVDNHGGATALCNDGSLSYSAHHQGTCSHHHGVAVWYK